MPKIGVLDSGVGGLTTVSAIMKQIEDVDVVYYADNGAGSYGNLSDAEIQATAYKGLKKLFASGAVMAVLACNTATVTSVEALRKRFRREIVGTEPAVRLAAGKSVTLVTAATARTLRYKKLAQAACTETVVLPELAAVIEKGKEHFDEASDMVISALENKSFDSVVLGCTHYVFLKERLKEAFPGAYIVDGNEGVAKRVERLLRNESGGEAAIGGDIKMIFSGENRKKTYSELLEDLRNSR